MSQYNKADTSKYYSYKCKERKMRAFIWEHWKNKKRGYMTNSFVGIDVSSVEHIFVKLNENGKWQIVWRLERHQVSGEIESFIDDFAEINSVEQVAGKSNKSDWKLVFKDEEEKL